MSEWKNAQGLEIHRYESGSVRCSDEGDEMDADLIINDHGRYYFGVDLGGGDWDYVQDKGDYIPVGIVTDFIENHLTIEDVDKWSGGELTPNTSALVDIFGAFAVWGGGSEGSEPLHVDWPQ